MHLQCQNLLILSHLSELFDVPAGWVRNFSCQLRALEHTFRRDQTDQLDQLSLIVKSRYAHFPFALSIDCEINLKGITKS